MKKASESSEMYTDDNNDCWFTGASHAFVGDKEPADDRQPLCADSPDLRPSKSSADCRPLNGAVRHQTDVVRMKRVADVSAVTDTPPHSPMCAAATPAAFSSPHHTAPPSHRRESRASRALRAAAAACRRLSEVGLVSGLSVVTTAAASWVLPTHTAAQHRASVGTWSADPEAAVCCPGAARYSSATAAQPAVSVASSLALPLALSPCATMRTVSPTRQPIHPFQNQYQQQQQQPQQQQPLLQLGRRARVSTPQPDTSTVSSGAASGAGGGAGGPCMDCCSPPAGARSPSSARRGMHEGQEGSSSPCASPSASTTTSITTSTSTSTFPSPASSLRSPVASEAAEARRRLRDVFMPPPALQSPTDPRPLLLLPPPPPAPPLMPSLPALPPQALSPPPPTPHVPSQSPPPAQEPPTGLPDPAAGTAAGTTDSSPPPTAASPTSPRPQPQPPQPQPEQHSPAASAPGVFKPRATPADGLLFLAPAARAAMWNAQRGAKWSLKEYELSRKLYRGYASTVYKATCLTSRTDVVLKVYDLKSLTEFLRHQVLRELDIHSRLKHPGTVQLLAAFREGNTLVLVLEYVRGGSLDQARRKLGGRMKEQWALHLVVLPLLRVLGSMHRLGVVHRDVKPDNVLFTPDWRLKLCDFGVSIMLHEERAVTRAGSSEYMAPEVNACPLKSTPADNKVNDQLAYGAAADVWSLGAVVYELLVGFTPFPGGPPPAAAATGNAATNANPIRVPSGPAGPTSASATPATPANASLAFPARVSPAARAFILACLEPHHGDRPTVEQLLQHPWVLGAAQAPPLMTGEPRGDKDETAPADADADADGSSAIVAK